MKTSLPLITFLAGFWFIACAAVPAKKEPPSNASISVAINKPFQFPREAAKDTGVQQAIQKVCGQRLRPASVSERSISKPASISRSTATAIFRMQSVYKLPISLALVKQYEYSTSGSGSKS